MLQGPARTPGLPAAEPAGVGGSAGSGRRGTCEPGAAGPMSSRTRPRPAQDLLQGPDHVQPTGQPPRTAVKRAQSRPRQSWSTTTPAQSRGHAGRSAHNLTQNPPNRPVPRGRARPRGRCRGKNSRGTGTRKAPVTGQKPLAVTAGRAPLGKRDVGCRCHCRKGPSRASLPGSKPRTEGKVAAQPCNDAVVHDDCKVKIIKCYIGNKILWKGTLKVALAGSLGRACDPRPLVVSSSPTSGTERTKKSINKLTKGIRNLDFCGIESLTIQKHWMC